MRKKALLAVAIATGMLNASPPTQADDGLTSESEKRSVHSFAANKTLPPEYRARQLISFACLLLQGHEIADSESRFFKSKGTKQLLTINDGSSEISTWANNIGRHSRLPTMTGLTSSDEQKALAHQALDEAVKLTAFAKLSDALPLEFAVESLLNNFGSPDDIEKSKARLEALIVRCEKESPPNFDDIKAAAAIISFNAGSREIAGLGVSDAKSFAKQPEDNFRKNEARRRRAIALLDHLPKTDHQRRMAHRDLTMMYLAQGEKDLAEKERKVLFKLVGIADDSILQPKSGGCGHVVWWRTYSVDLGFDCGMG